MRNEAELREAIDRIMSEVQSRTKVTLSQVLVSEMVSDGLEVIVGAVEDDVFGPTVLLGLGAGRSRKSCAA